MYPYPGPEPVHYSSGQGGARRRPAFELVNPFAPRRQRTLPVNSVRDVDEIPLPLQRNYHQHNHNHNHHHHPPQAGRSHSARPNSPTYEPMQMPSAFQAVHYAAPSEYGASHPVYLAYRPPILAGVTRESSSSSSEVQTRPPSSQSDVSSRPPSSYPAPIWPPSSQSDVPSLPSMTHSDFSRPPSSQSEVLSLSPPPSIDSGRRSRRSAIPSEHSSPSSQPIPAQYSSQRPSRATRVEAQASLGFVLHGPQPQPTFGAPTRVSSTSSSRYRMDELQNQSTDSFPSTSPSSSREISEKNSSIAIPPSAKSSSECNWDGYRYDEPTMWIRSSQMYPSVGTSFNKKPSLRFFFIDLLRDIYYLFLLNIPRLYYSRVGRVLKEAQLSLEEMMEMSLVTSPAYKRFQEDIMETGFFNPNVRYSTPAYERLRAAWELFIDGLLQDWKALNVMTVLLLSAIVSIFQIDSAADDPVTRYTAFASLICALMSLMYSCVFLTQFASMRQPYKALEWAVEAQKRQASLWNVWIMLATPVVWLSWSLIAFISSIMSFMWRVGIKISGHEISTAPEVELVCRVLLSLLFCMGIVYGVLIINTLRRYGSQMDEAWERRIDGFISRTSSIYSETEERFPSRNRRSLPRHTSVIPPRSTYPPPVVIARSASVTRSSTPSPSFSEPHRSRGSLGDSNHPREANADMVADSASAEWHPSLPLERSQSIGSGNINPSPPISKYGTHRWSHPPDTWIEQSHDSREQTDESISSHIVLESAFSPARERIGVAIAIPPSVDDLTTSGIVPRTLDESHHQTFVSGKKRGRSRSPSPVLDHLHSPPVSVNDTPRTSSDYIVRETLTSHTSSAREQSRRVDDTPKELSSTSVPDLPPPSPSLSISEPSHEKSSGLSIPTALKLVSLEPSSLPSTSLSLKETQ